MKVGRRAFIGFVAGAVGGTLLSPLPWKLADDIAIWTQNWSWRPSPERGHRAAKKTICTLCGGGCPIEVDFIDGKRAIYARGGDWGICSLGASAVQYLYAPYRVQTPLKQTKKRGDISGFKPITWNEALSEITQKITKLLGERKGHSVACITGQKYSSIFDLWKQFLRACGSKNVFSMPDSFDCQRAVSRAIFGADVTFGFNLADVTCVLSFGAEWADGWGPRAPMAKVASGWFSENPGKPVTEVIHVSSRLSMSAAKASEWVAVKPGTEAALALGIAHVMIKENRFDPIVREYAGFEDWTDSSGKERRGFKDLVLKDYTPEKVEKITGVEAQKIVEIAHSFAKHPKAVAIWGQGTGGPRSFYDESVFVTLNLLKGNLEKGLFHLKGNVPVAPLPAIEDEVVETAPRLEVAADWKIPFGEYSYPLYPFLDAVASQKGYPIELLFVQEANPVYCLPESGLVKEAFSKIGMVVDVTSFMDETAVNADIILPAPVMLERWDDVYGLPVFAQSMYALSRPLINAKYDVRHPGDVILNIAVKVGGTVKTALPWRNYTDYLKFRIKGIADSGRGAITNRMDELVSVSTVKKNFGDMESLWRELSKGKIWFDVPPSAYEIIGTDNGKPQFSITALGEAEMKIEKDELLLPHYEPFVVSKGSGGEHSLLLMAYNCGFISTGYLPNSYLMMKNIWDFQLKGDDIFVEINPATASKLGFREGDMAVLKTVKGEARVRVHVVPSVPKGVIGIPKGFGHGAYDVFVKDKGTNANRMVEIHVDPVTGLGIEVVTGAKLVRA